MFDEANYEEKSEMKKPEQKESGISSECKAKVVKLLSEVKSLLKSEGVENVMEVVEQMLGEESEEVESEDEGKKSMMVAMLQKKVAEA